jgi:hypothetical protein
MVYQTDDIKADSKQMKKSLEAERLWHNCIHKNIGSFTMSQEKHAIEDITKFLTNQKAKMNRLEQENAELKETIEILQDSKIMKRISGVGKTKGKNITLEDMKKKLRK